MGHPNDDVLKRVRAALELESHIRVHASSVHLELRDGSLILRGEVKELAAKRRAARAVRSVPGVREVVDRIAVTPAEPKHDGEILDALGEFLLRQVDLSNCSLRQRSRGKTRVLHEAAAQDRSGEIEFSAELGVVTLDGKVISLSHRRLVEVLAWWVPGSCDVVNRLIVEPAEQDGDDELADAIHLALELDPLLRADGQINVSVARSVVTLEGLVSRDEERRMAEFDTWCVSGVDEVRNRLTVAP